MTHGQTRATQALHAENSSVDRPRKATGACCARSTRCFACNRVGIKSPARLSPPRALLARCRGTGPVERLPGGGSHGGHLGAEVDRPPAAPGRGERAQRCLGHLDQASGRSLSLFSVTSLGIGALIGAGIFVLTGHAAAQYAGPAIILSYIGAGFICIFAGLCYSEMAACCPVAGSAYTYAFATMGELVAWMIGWDLILEYAVGAVTVAIGWSGYVVSVPQGPRHRRPDRLFEGAVRLRIPRRTPGRRRATSSTSRRCSSSPRSRSCWSSASRNRRGSTTRSSCSRSRSCCCSSAPASGS